MRRMDRIGRTTALLLAVVTVAVPFILRVVMRDADSANGTIPEELERNRFGCSMVQPVVPHKDCASVLDPRRLSPAVRVFASVSGAVPAGERRRRLAEFPDSLSGTEVSALTNFLAAAESRIPGVPPRDALSLKNEAANALLSRAPSGAGLAAFFASQFLDARNSRGWRDYALQALPWACLRDRDPASLRLAGNVFAAVFSSPRLRHFRGTALNGLAALDRAGAGLAAVPLEPAALSVLRDSQPDGNALLTSLALCRERGWTNAMPELRRLASSSPSPLVRKAAGAAIPPSPADTSQWRKTDCRERGTLLK